MSNNYESKYSMERYTITEDMSNLKNGILKIQELNLCQEN